MLYTNTHTLSLFPAFVGINANPRIKEYIIHRFARRTMQQQQNKIPSFLGEITIQDVQVGDSIPILSNPKLLELSADGSLSIEMGNKKGEERESEKEVITF